MALTGLVAANNLGDVGNIEQAWDNIGNNISATVFVPSPTLDLNFASNKSLVDNVSGQNLVTFSRASTGTFVGSNGLIQTAASNAPRFDHNPATGESLGLLMEEARTNLLQYSQDMTDATWGKLNTTVTKETLAGPAGTVPYDKITLGTFTGAYGGAGRDPISASPSVFYTASVYVKAGTCRYIGLTSRNYDSNGWGTYFDLQTGVVTQNRSSTTYSILSVGGGWYRLSIGRDVGTGGSYPGFSIIPLTVAIPTNGPSNNIQPEYNGNGEYLYAWAPQYEAGAFPTSYIPTVASAVTRAADVATITGSNYTNWYNQEQGSFFFNTFARGDVSATCGFETVNSSNVDTPNGLAMIPRYTGTNNATMSIALAGSYDGREVSVGVGSYPSVVKMVAAIQDNNSVLSVNGAISSTIANRTIAKNVDYMRIGAARTGAIPVNTTISRIVYWPTRLSNITLQTISASGVISSFPYSFSIKGKDILALKQVNQASTRDFIFAKGLLFKAQPRLTTASQYTSSGVALRNAAMPKLAPVTRGNYFFSSGLTLSGTTVQINGTNALSIATSPFSGSTAIAPLLFGGLRPQTNWRISEVMTSGVVASPENAIPIETSDFLLFIKAGQS
jgi:hypothetical protein